METVLREEESMYCSGWAGFSILTPKSKWLGGLAGKDFFSLHDACAPCSVSDSAPCPLSEMQDEGSLVVDSHQ